MPQHSLHAALLGSHSRVQLLLHCSHGRPQPYHFCVMLLLQAVGAWQLGNTRRRAGMHQCHKPVNRSQLQPFKSFHGCHARPGCGTWQLK